MNTAPPYIAIMAGGIGSRFYPSSRVARPKQFLDILGVGKSLIRLTFERFLKITPAKNIFILTNSAYKNQVLEHLPELNESQILCEPSRNNTAPCIAYTTFKFYELNPSANFVVAPSDHVILKEEEFINTLKLGLDFVDKNDALLTLGIQPSRPDTGYGYINFEKSGKDGIHKVKKFTEKPDLQKAKEFLQSGDYLWNAGIFLWNVASIYRAFESHANEIFSIFQKGVSKYNTPEEKKFIDEFYPTTPKISIDYAIMEKAENVYTIPSDFGWSDLGTWASLYAELEKDDNKNVLSGKNIMTFDTTSCLVRADNEKLVLLKDLDNYIIIDEKDVLLVFPKNKEQEIKKITELIKTQKGNQFL